MEVMTFKIILLMWKNQELNKFQRIGLQESSLEQLRLKNNQDQDSIEEIKKQQSRLGSIFFKKFKHSTILFYKRVCSKFSKLAEYLLSSNRLPVTKLISKYF